MTFPTSLEAAARYGEVQQRALSAYVEALRDALAPLEERYRKALGNLAGVQQNYLEELGRRLTAAYRSYGETVTAIPAGSAKLEPAVEAYNALVGKYAELADPGRWTDVAAPAQRKLNEAIAGAQGADDAPRRTQDAIGAFYGELNDLLRSDSSVADLSELHARYVGQLHELQADIEQGWQQAVETVNEHIKSALAETGKAFDLEAAVQSFTEELEAIGEELAEAYRKAADRATRAWQDSAPAKDATEAGATTRGSAFAAAASSSSPLAPLAPAAPPPVRAGAAPAAVRSAGSAPAAAMAVSPAAMPRASWVNIPQPPTEASGEAEAKKPQAKEPEAKEPQADKAEERTGKPEGGAPAKPPPASEKPKPPTVRRPGPASKTGRTENKGS